MTRYYDVKNISKDKWKGSITLNLSEGPGSGFSYYSLPADGVLENVSEEKVSEQMRTLAKLKRSRPPVIELVEVDYEARQVEKAKALDIAKKRVEKKAARKKAAEDDAKVSQKPLKEEKEVVFKKSKKSKKIKSDELSDEERSALEDGSELPL